MMVVFYSQGRFCLAAAQIMRKNQIFPSVVNYCFCSGQENTPTGCFYIALRLNSGRSGKEKGYSMADGLEQQIHCGLFRAYKAKAYA